MTDVERAQATERSAARAWHGLDGWLVRTTDGARARDLASLVRRPLVLDPHGVDEAWGLLPPTHRRTVIQGIQRRPPDGIATMPVERLGPDERDSRFEDAVEAIAARASAPALALGGGLDAAAVLLAWRERVGSWPAVLTLRVGRPDYDEVDAARSLCRALGAPLEVVDVPAASLVELMPRAVLAAGCPFYDLHPVGRLGLGVAAHRRGHRSLVTGDGADAVFRGHPDYDYVPIVVALTQAAELTPWSPFWDDHAASALLAIGPDPDKRWIRGYLERRGAPDWLVRRTKTPRRLGALDLRPDPDATRLLATALGRPVRLDTERERVAWASLASLVDHLEERLA